MPDCSESTPPAGRQAPSAGRQAPSATRRTPAVREKRADTVRPTISSSWPQSLFETPLRTSHRPYRDGDRLRREARRSHLMHAVWSIARARYPGRARRRGRQRRERKRNCGQPSRRTRRNRLLMGSNANVLGTREAGRPRQDRSTNRRPGDPGQRPSGENPGRRPPSEDCYRGTNNPSRRSNATIEPVEAAATTR